MRSKKRSVSSRLETCFAGQGLGQFLEAGVDHSITFGTR